jgi:hypothetical protein
MNGEEQRENALGNPAFFRLVQSTPHRHEDPEFLESGGVCSSRHMHDELFKIFRVELKSPEILIIIDLTVSQIPIYYQICHSFYVAQKADSYYSLQVHLGPEVLGDQPHSHRRLLFR